ncbi:MAG TPA: hypothetical protein VMI54_10085 [Polyangiaceae bacterium]|nr:hypothetical protein [Polyangiaceae bacterium]
MAAARRVAVRGRRRRWTLLCAGLACALAGALEHARSARACGGPDTGDFLALLPLDALLETIVSPEAGFGPRDELRFGYPLARARPAEFTELVRYFAGGVDPVPAPSTRELDDAIAHADLERARRAALAVVDALYRLPPELAAPHVRTVLYRALEVVELTRAHLPGAELSAFLDRRQTPQPSALSPALRAALAARVALESGGPLPPAAQNPRAASLEFVGFQRDFAARVPNGYASEAGAAALGPLFSELTRNVDAWIARYRGHPLSDLAELWKVRIEHFAWRKDEAYRVALGVWPRRPVRAAAEMEFLLATDGAPSPAVLDAIKDPILIAAFARTVTIDEARFNRYWKLALTAPTAPWSAPLQERLLLSVARTGKLPAEFPTRTDGPTPLWDELRALALMKSGQPELAKRELESMPHDEDGTRLLVKLHLSRGEFEQALLVPGVSEDVGAYVVKARLDRTTVTRIAGTARHPFAGVAQFELSLYAARDGKWQDAAKLAAPVRPERAPLFKTAARLADARGPDTELAFARFLAAHAGELLSDDNYAFYRGMSFVAQEAAAAGATSTEYLRMTDAMLRMSERYRALELYAHWLRQNATAPKARAVLAEADRTYAKLLYEGGSDAYFFGEYAPKTELAAELRALGKQIRSSR